MAIKTTLEQLEEVQAAITQVMTSQEMHGPDGRIIRADLAALQKREESLLARYRLENQGQAGPAVVHAVHSRDY